jgi:hypothetical protein
MHQRITPTSGIMAGAREGRQRKRAITVLWLPSVSGMARRLVRLSKRQSIQLASACYCHKDLDR